MADEITISVRAEDNFSGVLGNFGSIITGIESAINLAGQALSFFGDMAMEGLESIASYERLELSFQSLSASQMMMTGQATSMNAAMAESAIIAEDLLAWNQELAIHSPFTAEGVSEAFRMAMAYGFNVEESQRLTEAMIDFTAATGQTEFAMESIARALGQISATGKLTAQDMNQLTQVGVPALEILAEHFGVTTEEIIKMRADGLIPAQDAIEAITGWMETNFAGAANNFTNSWAGMISTFSDLKEIGLRELFTGMFDALQPLAVAFSSFIQVEGFDKFRDWGQSLGEITEKLLIIGATIGGFVLGENFTFFTDFLNNVGVTGIPGMRELSDLLLGLDDVTLDDIVFVFKELTGYDISGFVGDLESLYTTFQTFIETGKSDGWAIAIRDLFKSFDVSGGLQTLADTLATALSGVDWSGVASIIGAIVGEALILVFEGLDAIVTEVDWHPLGVALKSALSEIFSGLFDPSTSDFGYLVGEWANDIGYHITEGIQSGILWQWGSVTASIAFGLNQLIAFVKNVLGISSPSTVFKDIGKNIVQGLIDGWNNLWGTFMDLIGDGIQGILDLFAPFLALFGIDVGTSTGSGTLGGGSGGSDSTVTGTSGNGVVNNYFYGPVYIGSSLEDANYDCPSPNPLVAASGNQLVSTGY